MTAPTPEEIEAVSDGYVSAMNKVAEKARQWAAFYEPASDGRNTFILFAEWAEAEIGKQALRSLAPPGEWLPIESAPRADAKKPREPGPSVLVWDGSRMAIAAEHIINKDTAIRWWACDAWAGNPAEWNDDGGLAPVIDDPTHWRPLPDPPSLANDPEERS